MDFCVNSVDHVTRFKWFLNQSGGYTDMWHLKIRNCAKDREMLICLFVVEVEAIEHLGFLNVLIFQAIATELLSEGSKPTSAGQRREEELSSSNQADMREFGIRRQGR